MSGSLYSPCGWRHETLQKTEAVFWWGSLKGRCGTCLHPTQYGVDQDMGDGKA